VLLGLWLKSSPSEVNSERQKQMPIPGLENEPTISVFQWSETLCDLPDIVDLSFWTSAHI
jgi:hypothetical protein